jgi:hypothetical protein
MSHAVEINDEFSDPAFVNQWARPELQSKEGVLAVDDEETRMVKKIRMARMRQEFASIEASVEKERDIHQKERIVHQNEVMDLLRENCSKNASVSQKRSIDESFQNHAMSMYYRVAGGEGQRSIGNGELPISAPRAEKVEKAKERGLKKQARAIVEKKKDKKRKRQAALSGNQTSINFHVIL